MDSQRSVLPATCIRSKIFSLLGVGGDCGTFKFCAAAQSDFSAALIVVSDFCDARCVPDISSTSIAVWFTSPSESSQCAARREPVVFVSNTYVAHWLRNALLIVEMWFLQFSKRASAPYPTRAGALCHRNSLFSFSVTLVAFCVSGGSSNFFPIHIPGQLHWATTRMVSLHLTFAVYILPGVPIAIILVLTALPE